MKLYDVHTHIQDLRVTHLRDDIIRRSLDAGVVRIMCCGTREEDWEEVREMAVMYEPVKASYGIHPWFVHERSRDWKKRLESYLKEDPGAGVGEIGLDRMIPSGGYREQESLFIEQLKIARKYNRPVSLHCRKAWGVMPEIIKNEGGLPRGGVVHSWSGSSEMVKVFESMGAFISFSGSVTRENNKKAHKACRAVSKDRLMIETDSPDIVPDGVSAPFNEPSFVVNILETVALLRNEEKEDVAEYTFANSIRLFEDKLK